MSWVERRNLTLLEPVFLTWWLQPHHLDFWHCAFYLLANLVISHCLHVLAINKTRDENPESKSWLNYIYDDTLISILRQHQCVVPDSGLLYVVRRVIFALKKDPYTNVLCLYFIWVMEKIWGKSHIAETFLSLFLHSAFCPSYSSDQTIRVAVYIYAVLFFILQPGQRMAKFPRCSCG